MHSANHKTSPTASQLHQQPSSYTAFTVSAGPSRGQSHNTSIESVEGVPSRHPPQGGSTFLNNRRVPASWAGAAGGSSHPTTPKLGGMDGGVISGLAPISRLTPGPMVGAAGGSPSSVSSAASSAAGFPAAPQQQGGYGRRLPTNSPADTAQLDAHNTSVHSNGSDCPQVSQRRPPVQPQHKAALLRSQPSHRASPPSYHAPSATATAFVPANSSGPRQPSVQSDVPTGRRMMGGPVAPPSAQSVRVVTVQGRPVPMAAAYGADHDRSGGSGSRPPLSHRSTSSAESGGNGFGSASRLPTFPGSASSSRYNFHSDPYDRLQGRSGSAANSDKDLPPSRGSSDTPGRPKKPPTEPAPLEHRLKQREKQLKLGRVTGGYRNYRLLVPFHNRQQGNPDHPTTPDPTTECSKRQWDNLISCWRRDLHRWDTEDNASRKAMKSLRTEGELGRVKYENEDAYRARTMAELEQLYAEINERHNPPSGPPTPDLAPRSSGSGLGVAPFVIGGIGQSDADHSAAASRSGGGGAFGVIGGGAYHSKGGTTDCSSCASGYDPNSRYDPNAYRAPGSGAASVGAASVERKTSSRFGSEHTLGSGALAAEPVIENVEDRQRLNKELAIWQAQVTLPKGHHASTDSNDGGASTSNTGPTSPSIHVRVLAKDLWGRVEQLATSARGLLTSPTSGTVVVPLTPPTQSTLQRPPSDDESIDGYTSCLLATLATQFELEYLYVVPIQGAPTCLDSDTAKNFFKDTVKRILRESVPPPGTSITGDEFWGIVVNAFPVMVYAGELLYNPSVYSAHPVSSVGARSSHPSPIICRPDEGDEGSDIDIPPYETPRAHSSDDEQSPEILEMMAGRSVGVKQQQYDPHPTSNYTPLTMADTVAGRASAHDPRYASSTPEFFDAIGERWLHTPEGDLDTSTAPAGAFVGSGALLDVNETGGSCSPVHDIWTPNN